MPTDWSKRYAEGDTPWEKGRAHPALAAYVAEHPLEGRILVPGCGNGHDVRAIATATNFPVGMDLAEAAVSGARAYPAAGRETYRLGNFLEPSPEDGGAFDWVVEHTCFCAIDPEMREAYVRSVEHVLGTGGQLLAVFYLDPDYEEGPPFPTDRQELDALFSNFERIGERENLATFPGREGLEILRVLRK